MITAKQLYTRKQTGNLFNGWEWDARHFRRRKWFFFYLSAKFRAMENPPRRIRPGVRFLLGMGRVGF